MRTMTAALLLLGSATGCSTSPVEAPYNAVLSEFEDLKVPWAGCERDTETGELMNPNCRPSPPVRLLVQARVTNARTNFPMNNVIVRWVSSFSDIYLLPPEVMLQVEYPSGDEDGGAEWDDVAQQNEEQWAEFSGQFAGDYRPTYHEGYTDDHGNSQVWVWIQSMPVDDTGKAQEAAISVAIASDVSELRLQASE